ncbi:MAG: hypothetical protein SCJ93_08440 [Bacillota bacterium]|nr:hypothetical protein [Bacillota bacterium]
MSDTTWTILIIMLYFVSLIVIGNYVKKWVMSSTDFLISGREMHWMVLGAGVTAIYVAGSAVSAQPALAFNFGVGVWIFVGGMALGQLSNYFLLIKTPRRSGTFTMAEWFEMKFGVSARIATAIGFIMAYIPVCTAQLIGCAAIISMFTGFDYGLMIVILGVFTIVYITLAGIWSSAVSDTFQMVVMIVSLLILLPLILLTKFGGPGISTSNLPAEAFRFPIGTMKPFGLTLPSFMGYVFFLAIGVAIPAQHYWVRMASARNESNLKKAWIFQFA